MKVNYYVDKLVLVYQIHEDFMSNVIDSISLPIATPTDNIFIFSQKYMSVNYTCPIFIVEHISEEGEYIKIAEFRNDIHQAITLTVDNKLFYSGNLNLIYEFETVFNLSLLKINQIDIACDSNINLANKLNDIIHRPGCIIKRPGTKLPITEKGNQIVGTKVLPNIKVVNERERPKASFYYQLRTSVNRRPIIYRGYNKTQEISNMSHKTYIEEANGFDDVIYRFEVSIIGGDLKRRSKKDQSLIFENIYQHIEDKIFLQGLFKKYINRIANLWIGKRKYRISEILRLE